MRDVIGYVNARTVAIDVFQSGYFQFDARNGQHRWTEDITAFNVVHPLTVAGDEHEDHSKNTAKGSPEKNQEYLNASAYINKSFQHACNLRRNGEWC